jgi:hypothetical protein
VKIPESVWWSPSKVGATFMAPGPMEIRAIQGLPVGSHIEMRLPLGYKWRKIRVGQQLKRKAYIRMNGEPSRNAVVQLWRLRY